MKKIPKPKSGEITASEWEDHLESECGLSIIEPEQEIDMDFFEMDGLHENPGWHAGMANTWEAVKKQWYDQEPYDRVVVSGLELEVNAKEQLWSWLATCSIELVGEIFQSGGRWCMRVRDVEQ